MGSAVRRCRTAARRGGDSDNAGAIAGNRLGALLGRDATAPGGLKQHEPRAAIEDRANALFRCAAGAGDSGADAKSDWERSPN